MTTGTPLLSGALVLDKPEGVSSSQVVTRIKWALIESGAAPKTLRIGHGGTLDPFATGALLVLFGEATKLADAYLHSKKTYTGTLKLGVSTDSADLTGVVIEHAPIPSLSLGEWQTLADTFVGKAYFQVPPMHSAKKRDGIALYELARKGIEIEREAIQKKIDSFTLSLGSESSLAFEVACESGTYIRVLGEDLAKKGGTLAHLTSLRRTRSSDRTLDEALSLDATLEKIQTKTRPETLPNFIALNRLASHLPFLEIQAAEATALRMGQTRSIERLLNALPPVTDSGSSPIRYRIVRDEKGPVALLELPIGASSYRLQRIFNSSFSHN